jgi:hypothetical protein
VLCWHRKSWLETGAAIRSMPFLGRQVPLQIQRPIVAILGQVAFYTAWPGNKLGINIPEIGNSVCFRIPLNFCHLSLCVRVHLFLTA